MLALWGGGDHPRQKCTEFLDILAKNQGELQADYKGNYEIWMTNQKGRVAALQEDEQNVEDTEGEDSDTEYDTSSCPSTASNRVTCVSFKRQTKTAKPRVIKTIQSPFH